MSLLLGIIIVCGCVLGGFILSHGQVLALWQPNELLIIAGAACGAFIISNPFRIIKDTGKEFSYLLFGSKYTKQLYIDLLSLLFMLGTKVRRDGLLSVEDDIEDPSTSFLFEQYPQITNDSRLLDFITGNMRIIISGHFTGNDLETLLTQEIELIEEELLSPAAAINLIADAFPGFGIVAAVLGIVLAMQALGGDPKVLGVKVAAALVGTFLGIILSYGIVGPISIALNNQAKKSLKMYYCVKIFLVAFVAGIAPKVAIEYARRTLYSEVKPSFVELEQSINSLSY